MVRTLLAGGNFQEIIIGILVTLFVVVTCLPLHEMAHGLVAKWLGDPTAKMNGRLTLNPLSHLDPLGTLSIFLFGFGWARPVPVNPYNFKNRKAGMALTALAGPVSNILAAFVATLILTIIYPAVWDSSVAITIFSVFISVNLSLAVFNLLPVPPLDGSRIVAVLIPNRYQDVMYRYERYIMIVVMVLLFTGVLRVPLDFLRGLLEDGIFWLCSAIVGIFR